MIKKKNQNQAKIIAFFNNKGGVSKTTTCFNLGWKLSQMGKRVVMVDIDPQCNLTGLSLESKGSELIPREYQNFTKSNIYDALLPAVKSTGKKITSPSCVPVARNKSLFLLPGNVKLAEMETQLATAMNMGAMLPAMQNVPGSFAKIYDLIAYEYSADYILLDMSPSLGALNQVNFLNSDFFIIPMVPDVFSVMALESLASVIPGWVKWSEKISQMGLFSDDDLVYPFDPKIPKFLGTIIQRYRIRNGMPSKSFDDYFCYLYETTRNTLIPSFKGNDLLLDSSQYGNGDEYALAEIPDFNSLIACAQMNHKPVFELTARELATSGAAEKNQLEKIDQFKEIFDRLGDLVVSRTS